MVFQTTPLTSHWHEEVDEYFVFEQLKCCFDHLSSVFANALLACLAEEAHKQTVVCM